MGYCVVGEYWLTIQSFNQQTAIINIHISIFKNWNEYIFNQEATINKCKVKTVNLNSWKCKHVNQILWS